jgi:glycosyltransferase involved in cell wall biosynthesis
VKPLRLALTTNYSPWSPYAGGGQRSTHKIAVALSARGHDVTVVYTRPPGEKTPVPDDVPYKIRWATFFARKSRREAPGRPLNAFSVAHVVSRLHREDPLDALHGNGEESVLAVRALRRQGVVTVVTPRYPNLPAPLLAEGGPGKRELVRIGLFDTKFLLIGTAIRWARWCCPTSKSAARMMAQAFDVGGDKVQVVPNGIDRVFFDAKWSPSDEERPVVFFGRLSTSKGVDLLLDALALVRDAGRTPPVVIIGRGDQEEALRAQAERLGLQGVRFEPWMDAGQLAQTLAHASLAVLPSRHESFGNAMAEAMAVGTPLISTRAGSIPEVVREEETGLLVPSNDAPALAAAMQRLLADDAFAAELGSRGRTHVRESFSWDRVAAQYEALYRRA